MTATAACPECGAPLASPTQPCPRCLLRLGIESKPPSGTSNLGQVHSGPAAPRPPPPTAEEMAKHFRDLEVLELCGQGGMGIVYKARHTRLDRIVALKVLHQDASRDPAFAERFLREARALARLSHPGIVGVYDFGEVDGLYYLVMEFIDGVDLRRTIRGGELAPRQALTIVRELCDALQYAHDEGVVHRDIKPENVLIDRRGRVKIADFGLAKLAGAIPEGAALTATGQVMGTPHYMAPEQVERPHDVDHRADIYSLGVVLYEMLTGSLPLGRFEPPSRRVQIDVRLDDIVLRTLEREPALRYQHAVDVKTDVDLVGLGEKQSATPSAAKSPSMTAPGLATAANEHEDPVFVASIESNIDMSRGLWPTAIFAFTWVVVGWMFNLGAWGMVWAGLFVIGGSHAVVSRRIRRIPELAAALSKESRAKKNARATGALLCLWLGLAAIVMAHIAAWERGTASYEPPAGALYLATNDHGNWSTLQEISFPGSDVVSSLEDASFEYLDRERLLFRVPWLAFVAIAAASWLVAALCMTWRRSSPTSIRAGIEVVGGALVALVLLHAVWGLLGGTSTQLERYKQDPQFPGTADEVYERVHLWLLENGYQVHAKLSGTVRFDDASTSRHLTFIAHSGDPFDRWHVSWRGPERVTPHLYIGLSGSEQSTWMHVESGLRVAGSRSAVEWDRRLLGLYKRLGG